MSALPNDSAICVGPPESEPSKSPSSRSPSSPHPPSIPYSNLTPAEQAAQDLENAAALQQAQGLIDPESGDNSSVSDAGYETDSIGSATTSLNSSVRDYIFENGRRYHRFREGAYNFPNDDAEQDREDMKHAMMVTLCQQLHFAPIGDNPQNILDMGTGTGIWAIESEIRFSKLTWYWIDLLIPWFQWAINIQAPMSAVLISVQSNHSGSHPTLNSPSTTSKATGFPPRTTSITSTAGTS